MSNPFTPGPWTAYDFGPDWYVGTGADDSGPMLRVGSIYADREANAHLIAAAPELYHALELALPRLTGSAWASARNALAKARGEVSA